MNVTITRCHVAGDRSYYLAHSALDSRNWYIRNERTGAIVWNGAFDTNSQAIEAAEMDGFEFDNIFCTDCGRPLIGDERIKCDACQRDPWRKSH